MNEFIERIDENFAEDLLKRMIKAPSVNPPGNERGCAEIIQGELRDLGLKVDLIEKRDHRTNVVARLKGEKGEPTLLYNGHMDVVPPGHGWSREPFGGEIIGRNLYGRGAADMKSGLASMITGIKAIVESGIKLEGDLILTAVADEETGSVYGTRHLIEMGIRADMAVVSEPTDLRIEIANKGLLWIKISTHGRGSHASRPHLGVNAISKMMNVVSALQSIKLEGVNSIFDVPTPTLSVTTIEGGTKVNVIPDLCTIGVDRRLLPGEDPHIALQLITDVINNLKGKDTELNTTLNVLEEWPPMEISKDEPIVKHLTKAVETVTGRRPNLYGKAAGTDASFLVRDAKIPTALFGPGDPSLSHTPDEHVNLDKVTEAAKVFATLAFNVLKIEN